MDCHTVIVELLKCCWSSIEWILFIIIKSCMVNICSFTLFFLNICRSMVWIKNFPHKIYSLQQKISGLFSWWNIALFGLKFTVLNLYFPNFPRVIFRTHIAGRATPFSTHHAALRRAVVSPVFNTNRHPWCCEQINIHDHTANTMVTDRYSQSNRCTWVTWRSAPVVCRNISVAQVYIWQRIYRPRAPYR